MNKDYTWPLAFIALLLMAILFKMPDAHADEFYSFNDYGGHNLPQNSYHCLAEAMYFEGGVDGRLGMYLIGEVIINRVNDKVLEFKDLNNVCDVVHQPSRNPDKPWECAFSYHCDGKPEIVPNTYADQKVLGIAQSLAIKMLNAIDPVDFTDGALYYTQPQIARGWMKNTEITLEYLGHVFRKPINDGKAE